MENLNWTAYEYEETKRSTDWFWALGIIVVCSSVASIIFGNYFLGILLILSGLSFAMLAIKKPEEIHYQLNKDGLQIKDQLYLYKEIKSFFVREIGKPVFFIKSNRIFLPMISIPLEGVSPRIVKNIMLAKNVPEEEMQEHFSEKIIESLGL